MQICLYFTFKYGIIHQTTKKGVMNMISRLRKTDVDDMIFGNTGTVPSDR